MSNEVGTQEKVTVQVAAKALGVSIKTVHRYLQSGILTKIKDGQRVYIPADEIRRFKGTDGQTVSTEKKDTITLDLSRYDAMLTELGELRKQSQFLLEYRAEIKSKDDRIINQTLELEQTRLRLRELEVELDQVKQRRPWWKFWGSKDIK